ncbi:MAG: carbamoyltransferase HypF [Calothrix sp. MO_167.B42]|nr:carbamoyltransferase HypF [Calothrix sp. MO_167.B42]
MKAEAIRVRGTVQGVGFRPTVYRLAKAYGLCGDVCNDGEGVLIRVWGSEESITEFVIKLQQECPPLAKITQLTRQPYQSDLKFDDFVITPSISSQVKTDISPDAATCPQCQQEIFSLYSPYYRYPFTNCTHCGPRLSIITAIPYDRCNTSMAAFPMCEKCTKEYQDIENRRFHAQPTACHICGPQAWLERADSKPITASMFSMLDDVDAVCTLLQKGEIVAIKGIGGFHLACDATNHTAVQKLRQRKHRHHKPFALMARDIDIIAAYCHISHQEKQLLTSPAAPIVLLQKRQFPSITSPTNNPSVTSATTSVANLCPSIAPQQTTLGFILPYTPLHHLILKRMNRPIIFTSGNLSNEPQSIDNNEAKNKLSKIADYFLLHNRDIINRVDDSVVRVINNQIQIIRRARGYAPAPINLPLGFSNTPPVLAMGGELKNTFCLLKDGQAILSQHLGDLENLTAFRAYQQTLNLYLNLFQHQPEIIATDKHPEYLSTKLGKQLATANQIPIDKIQHHHAHIAACMAENNLPLNSPPILGIAFDGLGYGEDKTFWGGEFLLADYQQFQRLAKFKPVAMIGGSKAIKEPWRNTYAHLISAFNWDKLTQKYRDLEIIKFLQTKPLTLIDKLLEQQINCPPTSSVGRLFDAVAAAIAICREECSYEGQAAIEMENLVKTNALNNGEETLSYSFNLTISDNIYCIDPSSMWQELLDDLEQQVSPAIIATKFHHGLAKTIVNTAQKLCQENGINQVALTGGVFQNTILLEKVKIGLENSGIKTITHSLIPANDGGLSLGQAVIAAAKLIIGK